MSTQDDKSESLTHLIMTRASNAELNPIKLWEQRKQQKAEALRGNPSLKEADEHYQLAKAQVARAKANLKVPVKAAAVCDQIEGFAMFLTELGYTNAADDVRDAKTLITDAIKTDN